MEFNIVYLVTDHTDNYVAYLFNNSNKSESGVYLAKYFNPTAYLNFGWTKSAFIYFIVFTVLFGLYFFVCEILSSGLVKMIVGA